MSRDNTRAYADTLRSLNDDVEALREALDDVIVVGKDERLHVPACLEGAWCRCHRYRRLLHQIRGVQCEQCQDTGEIDDPTGPDRETGRSDVIGCPECSPVDHVLRY